MDFAAQLERELGDIRAQGLHRSLRRVDSPQAPRLVREGRALLNFSANDYLGLANHPAVKAAATQAVAQFGAGSGASRLISGSLAPHHELEQALARFKGTESALSFASGYAAATGTLGALLGKDDILIVDKLVHACIVDAARLCGARLRVFAHNQVGDLEKRLAWAAAQRARQTARRARILVVVESVYSMDGDQAPLREIVARKEKYGAWLMVDEAHATGLFGARRSGLIEELALGGRVEIQMGTLGKALGSAGGFIAGPRALVELLVNRARSFIFSTAPVPAAAAAARAAVELVQTPEGAEHCRQLWARVNQLKDGLGQLGWRVPAQPSAIFPLVVGAEADAVALAQRLLDQGIYVPAIRYPTVARGAARLRLTVSAAHTEAEVAKLLRVLAQVHAETPPANANER